MKRLFKGIAAAGLSLMMLAGNTMQMFADEIIPPQTPQKTTKGVELETKKIDVDHDGYTIDGYDVVVTIPEGFTEEFIQVYPMENVPTVTIQPGDSSPTHVKIVNESGQEYYYVENSLKVSYPDQNLNVQEVTVARAYNDALADLGINESSDDLTDANVGAKLLEKGYGADEKLTVEDICVKYLDDYYVDYYNKTFKGENEPEASTLREVSRAYRIALFNTAGSRAPNGEWVGNTHWYSKNVLSRQRESNEEVNRLSYDHAYKDLLWLNKYPFDEYTDPSNDAYKNFNNFLNTNVLASDGFDLDRTILGGMGNVYMKHILHTDLSFTLVRQDVTPERKVSNPDLEKKITGGEDILVDETERPGDYATVDASGKVEFTLTSHVGDDLKKVIKPIAAGDPGLVDPETETDPVAQYDTSGTYTFTFVDHLDAELELIKESIEVTVNGTTVTLPKTAVTTSTVPEGEEHAGRTEIRVSFDLVDLFEQGLFTYEEFGKAPIVMTYSANVKDPEHVTPGKMYNTAWVEYQDGKTEPDDVDVDTFGVKVFKYDQTTKNGLSGAQFELYYQNGEEFERVGETVVSDETGYVVFKGLKEGTYKIVETKAPAGYVKSNKPLMIQVNKDADDDTYYVNAEFANVPEVHTGGSGTMLFTLGGGALLVIGAATYLISKKRQEN